MAEAEEIRDAKHDSSFPRDLLQRFVCGSYFPRKSAEETALRDEEENIELSLGLSLNGRFGVNPENAKTLIRASSTSNFMSMGNDETMACLAPFSPYPPLTRTCSLPSPSETEEEWRKRKELQSLRRLEAKRKRIEKLKNVRVVKGKIELEQNLEENGRASMPINGNDEVELKGERRDYLGGGGVLERLKPTQFSSQGSIGSQGSGSSGISDFESQPIPGTNKNTEVRSPASVQSPQEQIEQKQAANPGPISDRPTNVARSVLGNPAEKVIVADGEANEMVRNMMADMPCVSTKGLPNGRRIEGFLYRYGKGEEVRIVCVCHGSFLTPAEFVKHGGGGDVAHPLRHIVVTPPSFS